MDPHSWLNIISGVSEELVLEDFNAELADRVQQTTLPSAGGPEQNKRLSKRILSLCEWDSGLLLCLDSDWN